MQKKYHKHKESSASALIGGAGFHIQKIITQGEKLNMKILEESNLY
jgi:hypothetical protein